MFIVFHDLVEFFWACVSSHGRLPSGPCSCLIQDPQEPAHPQVWLVDLTDENEFVLRHVGNLL
jgi:hypothetical protein